MDMTFGIASVAVISVICYLIGMVVKATGLDNKWIPSICGVAGAALGGTTLTIGPVSSGDRGTIRSKCQELQLMSLYHEAKAGGMHTITVGPLSAGDVASLKALCEQLHLTDMGLYKEQ